MTEIWKEYAPEYLGSNFGRVKSLKWGKEKILKPSPDNNGYLFVKLQINGESKNVKVHRIVAELFIPTRSRKSIIKTESRRTIGLRILSGQRRWRILVTHLQTG